MFMPFKRRKVARLDTLPPFLNLKSIKESKKRSASLKGYFAEHPEAQNEEFYYKLTNKELCQALCGLVGFHFGKEYLTRLALLRLLFYLVGVKSQKKDIFVYHLEGRYGDDWKVKADNYRASKNLDPKKEMHG